MATRIRLLESLRAVFYTPYYASIAGGAFEREGLEVELYRPPVPDEAVASLFDGRADVTWGGPMRMLQYLDAPGARPLVGFAEAVTRDPFYLIGARPNNDFRFKDLMSLRLATVAEVPTPWMCLQDDLRRAGLDPAAVSRETMGTMAQNVEALAQGRVDVVQVFEPYAGQLLRSGQGYLWYAAATRGPTSYTTLYTSRQFADENPELLVKLSAALYRTQKWLRDADSGEIATLVQPYFAQLQNEELDEMVARYRANGVWGENPLLPLVGYVRLKCALLSGGLIGSDFPFTDCIDNQYARRAIAMVDGA